MVLLSHEYKQKNKAKTVVKHTKKKRKQKYIVTHVSTFGPLWILHWSLTSFNALQNMLFIRRKRALPPGNQSGINADFTQRRNVFTFPIFHTHSTRNGHKKTRSLSTEIYAKITSEGNRGGWTCRSREWDFNTVIYIVKMAHSAHLLTKMLMMTLQMVEFKVCSGSQNYTIFHIFYFVEIRHKSAFVYNNGLTPKLATGHFCK